MLPFTSDIAARFEARADRSVGGGQAQPRSIAKEVGVQPRIVSLWRHRYADHGLEGLQDKPRPGKQPIYTKATDKRILKLLDKSPPEGFARWTGPGLDLLISLAAKEGSPNVQFHFTPTSASWLKQVGVWFSISQGNRLAAPPSQASNSSRSTSMPTSRHITTKLSPSSGPRKRSVNVASKATVTLSYDSGY
jgi:transposase